MEALFMFLNSIYPLSPELRDYLSATIKYKEIARKEYLLRAGNISRQVCFIVKGLLRCYHMREDTEVSRWFMREGDVVFSISSFYEQKKGFENIQALEDCGLFYISYDELEYIYKNFLEFNYIGRVLTIKYHQLWDEQLYSLQMQNAKDRYLWMLHKHSELLQRVPAKFIASWLDITPVTLSRMRGKLKGDFKEENIILC